MIGYPSEQDPAIFSCSRFLAQSSKKIKCSFPCDKSFIDQDCMVTMAGHESYSSLVWLWTEIELRYVNMQKELGQCPALLTSLLVNNTYVLGFVVLIDCFHVTSSLSKIQN